MPSNEIKPSYSLTNRLLLAVGVSFIAFLGFTGYALDNAFQQHTRDATHERLENLAYTVIAVAELDPRKGIRVPNNLLLEPDFHQAHSGLYAEIIRNDFKARWHSSSAENIDLPSVTGFVNTRQTFEEITGGSGAFFHFAIGISLDDNNPAQAYTFNIFESKKRFDETVAQYRHSLQTWLGGAAIALLGVIALTLRWGLQPLRYAANEIKKIELGEQEILQQSYPSELRGLSENINGLIQSSQARLERYRNSSADLAHSLKTPLALMQGAAETESSLIALKKTVDEQVARINEIVDYQLQRAATSGSKPLSQPIDFVNITHKIGNSLQKVYADKPVALRYEMKDDIVFHGDESDLMEALGNLLDNAFKWCEKQVLVTASFERAQQGLANLKITVEDDGPGLDPALAAKVIERGVRSDGHAGGSGIGLAVVQDIAKAYHGELLTGRSETLNGAQFTLTFSQ